jgi:hypothetical protein
MAEITHSSVEHYRVQYSTGAKDQHLSMSAARGLLLRGLPLGLYVDGWQTPWPCRLDALGEVRARCPGGQAEPRVVGGPPDEAA